MSWVWVEAGYRVRVSPMGRVGGYVPRNVDWSSFCSGVFTSLGLCWREMHEWFIHYLQNMTYFSWRFSEINNLQTKHSIYQTHHHFVEKTSCFSFVGNTHVSHQICVSMAGLCFPAYFSKPQHAGCTLKQVELPIQFQNWITFAELLLPNAIWLLDY